VVVDANVLLAHLSPHVGQQSAQVVGQPPHWAWPAFWGEMASCGSVDMQAIFVLPEDLDSPTRSEMRDVLGRLAASYSEYRRGEKASVRRSFYDLPRHYYVPIASGSDSYRQVPASALPEWAIALTEDDAVGMAICGLPFDALVWA
jgi:hypothetical protein